MSLAIGNVQSAPGTKERGFVKVLTMADGGDLSLPVHIVTGTTPGPTLCLTAALHGDEVDSISTVREIVTGVDVNELSGTIVAVPVCSPPGLEAWTYNTPMDGMHMDAHAFPGDRHGTLTQQIAYAIAHEIVTPDRVDVLIDVHSTPRSFSVEMKYLYVSPAEGEVGRRSEELALVQGYEILYRGAAGANAGSLVAYAASRGIPSAYSNGNVRDIENVMKHLGMIAGEPILPDRQFITQPPRTEFRPMSGGLIYPEFSLEQFPDQIVPEGTVLGRVISPYTFEEVERFVAPFEAAVSLWCVGRRRFNPGDFAYLIGRIDDVEWIRR
jgi:uncharacterized protein